MALDRKQLPQEIQTRFTHGEYFGHFLAYNAAHCKPGEIVRASDGHDYHVYPVSGTAAGLFAYVLVPRGVARPHLTILFRGTKDKESGIRDVEEKAPGHLSFYNSLNAIYDALAPRLAEISEAHPDEPISVSIDGHSLGAADAQYMYVELMDRIYTAINSPRSLLAAYAKIKSLTMLACNAAGVTQEVIEKGKRLLAALKNSAIEFSIDWLHAAGDIVQQSGQGHIFSDASIEDGIKITLLKTLLKEIPSEKIWTSWLSPSEMLAALRRVNSAHRTHYFSGESLKNADVCFDLFTNESKKQTEEIHAKLSKQIAVPYVIQCLQKAVAYLYPVANSKSNDYVLVEKDGKTDELHDICLTIEELEALEEKLTLKEAKEKQVEEEKHPVPIPAPTPAPAPPAPPVTLQNAALTKMFRDMVLNPPLPVVPRYRLPPDIMRLLFLPEEQKTPAAQSSKTPAAASMSVTRVSSVRPLHVDIKHRRAEEKINFDKKSELEVKPRNAEEKKSCTIINETHRRKLIAELDSYINSRCYHGNPDVLNWTSWFFRSTKLTKAKIKLMFNFKQELKDLTTIEEINKKVDWYKNENDKLQKSQNKNYHFGMESDLVRCLTRVESTITGFKLKPVTYRIVIP